jgi:anti-sigma regulatory factor (Ser/Thr protein kinase)
VLSTVAMLAASVVAIREQAQGENPTVWIEGELDPIAHRVQRERGAAVTALVDRADLCTLRLTLERDRWAPSLARAAVKDFTQESEIDCTESGSLMLLVSELVSNAVLHSDAPPASGILLCARLLDRGAVRVEVIDRGSGFTVRPRDPARADGGFGLYLVDRQANCWGVDRAGGTRVWFELGSPGRRDEVA